MYRISYFLCLPCFSQKEVYIICSLLYSWRGLDYCGPQCRQGFLVSYTEDIYSFYDGLQIMTNEEFPNFVISQRCIESDKTPTNVASVWRLPNAFFILCIYVSIELWSSDLSLAGKAQPSQPLCSCMKEVYIVFNLPNLAGCSFAIWLSSSV